MIQNLEQALHTIKMTMFHHDNCAYFPYFFIVGAGISIPEIPSASGIIDICKKTVKEMDPELFVKYDEESKAFSEDGMKYYSAWIEYAYPNRINRSALFKKLCADAKISAANLMLAQILNSGEFANTVFTTNFDNSIKLALDLMGTKNVFYAENILDNLVVSNQTKDIQVVHVHGTYNFYDCANLESEIDDVASQTGTVSSSQLLHSFLVNQAPIIVGYSGWENDVIMRCLKERLSYPTPLQYIWVCYDRQSYDNLPTWIKENDCVIFVIPEVANDICEETTDVLGWDAFHNGSAIDATVFFKRIISSFKLEPPLIFVNPYSYYSQKIQTVLPKDEDVLHLRHWTQRLRLIENDDQFEKMVQKLETAYIAKDYIEANNTLLAMIELQLNETNAEFVCTSLIREFIRDEDAISSFDDRLNFHLTALAFIEKNLLQFRNTKGLISTLRAILFTKFRQADIDKMLVLLEKVIEITSRDARLLIVELTAMGVKSVLVEKEHKAEILQELLQRYPEGNDDLNFMLLKFRSLCELAKAYMSDDSIPLISQAESLLVAFNEDVYAVQLSVIKSDILPFIVDEVVKRRWVEDVIATLSSPKDNIDTEYYLEIASNINMLTDKQLFDCENVALLEASLIKILSNSSIDYSKCHSRLQYTGCCALICKITQSDAVIANYCRAGFSAISLSMHTCDSYLIVLHMLVERFFSLSSEYASESEKVDLLLCLRENESTNGLYFQLLYYCSACELINDFSKFESDMTDIQQQSDCLQKGLQLYCDGNHMAAEMMFAQALGGKVPSIVDNARTNLLYMIRRNETLNEYSIEDIISHLSLANEFALVNLVLYYMSIGDTSSDAYTEAKAALDQISEEQRSDILQWWNNINLVGEEESKLVLSLISQVQ